MAITKDKKKELVVSLTDSVKNATSTVLVGFNKLKISDVTPLRKTLREQGVKMVVSKKTLMKRAFNEAGITGTLPQMDGQVALAFGSDEVTSAKLIAESEKKLKGMVSIIGGILEGKFLSKSEMVALSKVPSREVLLSQLLNVMNAPIQGFVGTVNGVVRDFVMVLDQVAKKKQ
ncbi:MAG: 50S ribosomal protein L10 [bacterium]